MDVTLLPPWTKSPNANPTLILHFGQPAPCSAQVPGGSKSPNFQNNIREQAHTPSLPGNLATNTSRKAKNMSVTWGTGCSGQGGAWASPGCCLGVQQGVEVNLQVGLQGGIDAESLPVEIQQTVLVLGRAGLVTVSCSTPWGSSCLSSAPSASGSQAEMSQESRHRFCCLQASLVFVSLRTSAPKPTPSPLHIPVLSSQQQATARLWSFPTRGRADLP